MSSYEAQYNQVVHNLHDMYEEIVDYPVIKIREVFFKFCLFFIQKIHEDSLIWFKETFAFYDLWSKDWFLQNHNDNLMTKVRAEILSYFEFYTDQNQENKDKNFYSLHIIHSLFFINMIDEQNFDRYFDCLVIKLFKYQQTTVRQINEGISQALS